MEFLGTKGSWKLMRHVSTAIESELGRFVATSGSYSDGTEESDLENKANAKAIAATPDLIAACVFAMNKIHILENTKNGVHPDVRVDLLKMKHQIQFALEKALTL